MDSKCILIAQWNFLLHIGKAWADQFTETWAADSQQRARAHFIAIVGLQICTRVSTTININVSSAHSLSILNPSDD